ncbi:uncharacterized protein LOC116349683 [Contarinia nasturtii]|uniref:uncharacterized protein LOC116349683 n=1 Tax=Contarinia nasturtii TaxID=265458 RepID=UPI0012D47572|nr:uncharacterized protein LOC116349683 [Contarinia nasturtii]
MCHNAPAIYNKWAESVSSSLIDVSIQTYSGVNLSDPQQRDEILYPTYRFNMHVIDFYLAKFVFPREAKTFEYKLMCSTWDLCSFALEHPLRGFSGTNDTKNILPMSVEQNDLPELESTNEEVRKTLLLPENQDYKALEANVSGRAIIGQLVDCEIPVLLDSGALMLELNNQQVAKEWLALAPDTFFDAAVFFDTNDVIQTIDRKEIVTEFDCSVYREKLNRCLVYLDDVHTRGTDLKFPLNWKACVTLSGDITRDKTVQACMRMRQLGKGQSIAFWASYEADLKIQKLCESKAKPHECTPNQHVVEFICNNSKTVETENTVHWAAGAHNYTKKLIGHLTCGNHNDRLSLDHLLRTVIDGEITKLEDMYGDKQEAPLADITRNKFNKLARDFSDFRNVITNLENSVQKKVEKQASNVKRFVQGLDEEQERELEKEMELEQECQIERPNRMSPVKPEFDKKLQHFISEGATTTILSDLLKRQCLISLGKSLENSQLIRNHVDETKAWSDYIFVTKDFTQVCTKCERYYGFHSSLWSADDYSLYHSQPSRAKDAYMRPIWWIARVEDRTSGKYYLILLSSFECDRLLSTFKKSKNAALFLYRPKLSKFHNDLLHQSKLQVSAMTTIPRIDIHDQVQIAMYSGAMYFNNKSEQNAYCNFLGLIPRPRPDEFEADIFESNGFVPPKNRSHSTAISNAVGKCKFNKNPADLAIKLIQAHHYALPEECHAFSILKQGLGDLTY